MKMLKVLLLLYAGSSALAQEPFWRPLDGPYGGHVLSIVSAPNGDVYANTLREETMRSTDDGRSWHSASFGGNAVLLLVSQSGARFAFDYWDGTITRSDADSTSGERLPISGAQTYHALMQTPTGALVFAGRNGIHRSTDDGVSWSGVGPDATTFRFAAAGPMGTLFSIADTAGIFRSSDDGVTWTRAGDAPSYGVASLVVTGANEIAVGTSFGVFRSSDLGTTYSLLALEDLNSRDNGLVVLPDGNLLAATRGGLFRIARDGATTPVTSVHWNDLHAVHRTRRGAILVGYDGRGILRSADDGATFDAVGCARAWEVFDLTEGPDASIYAAVSSFYLGSGGDAIYRSTNRGTTWSDLNFSAELPAEVVVTRAGSLLVLGGATVYRSTDDGASWTAQRLIDDQLNAKLLETTQGSILLATYLGMFRSTDDGMSWLAIDTVGIRDISQSPDGELVALGFTDFLRSRDDGASWTSSPITAPQLRFGFHLGLETPADGVIVLVTRGALPEMAQSTDAGTTWDTTGFTCGHGTLQLYDERERGMFLVSDCGIFISRDHGRRWERMADKPGGYSGEILAHSSGDLFYGAIGMYVGRLPSSAPAGDRLERATAVYPNPARDEANVDIDLRSTAWVEIYMRNLHGEVVAGTQPSILSPGKRSITMRVDVPSGIYFVDLVIDGTRTTHTMTIVR
jgi:hypothetical protein